MTIPLQPYLLTFDPDQRDLPTMKAIIDGIPEVQNWSDMFGNSMVLISESDAAEIGALLKKAFPGQRFVVAKIERGARSGWLPRNLWAFINEPHAA